MALSASEVFDRVMSGKEPPAATGEEFPFEWTKESLPYKSLIEESELMHGIPKNLLARNIKQESRFNPKAVSPKGAQGIAQILPSAHPGVDALNPKVAIPYAAGYLKSLYNQFGSWDQAIAAYNHGPENLKKSGMSNLPVETLQHVSNVYGQIPTNGTPLSASDVFDLAQTKPAAVPVAPKEPTIVQPPKPPGGYDELGRPLAANGIPYPAVNPFTGEGSSNKAFLGVSYGGWPVFGFGLGSASDIVQRPKNPLVSPTNPRGEALSTFRGKETISKPQPQSLWQWMRGWVSTPTGTGPDKAAMITGLKNQTGLTPTEILKNYPELMNEVVARQVPTVKQIGERAMEAGIVAGAYAHPLVTASVVLQFMGMDELVNKLVSDWKGVPYQFQGGLGFSDLMQAQGFSKDAIDLMQFMGLGLLVGGGNFKGGGEKSIAEIRSDLAKHPIPQAPWLTDQSLANRGIIGKYLSYKRDKIAATNELAAESKVTGKDPTEIALEGLKEPLLKDELATKGEEVKVIKGEPIPKEQLKLAQEEVAKVTARQAELEAAAEAKKAEAEKKKADKEAAKEAAKVSEIEEQPIEQPLEEPVVETPVETQAKPLTGAERAAAKKKSAVQVFEEATGEEPIEPISLPTVDEATIKEMKDISEKTGLDLFGLGKKEPITDLDLQTGTPKPEALSTDKNPFREVDSEVTTKKNELYSGLKSVAKTFNDLFNNPTKPYRSPETTTSKLINDVNRWLDGDNTVDIAKTRDMLSEMAARANELKPEFSMDLDHKDWANTTSEAAVWARQADRAKIERTEGPSLYSGIPLDQIKKLWRIPKREFITREEYLSKKAEQDRLFKEYTKGMVSILDTKYEEGMNLKDYKVRKEYQDIIGEDNIAYIKEGIENPKYTPEQARGFLRDRSNLIDAYDEAIKIGDVNKANDLKGIIEDHYVAFGMSSDLAKIARQDTGGIRLNIAIPLDEIPKAVKDLISKVKVTFGDLYRNKEILDKTGFWFGKDGMWRYDLDSSDIKIVHPELYITKVGKSLASRLASQNVYPLPEVISAPKLFEAVPELRTVGLRVDPTLAGRDGNYNPASRLITVNSILKRDTFIHELSHSINDLVGSEFRGTNPESEQGLIYAEIFNKLTNIAKSPAVKEAISEAIMDRDFINKPFSAIAKIRDAADKFGERSEYAEMVDAIESGLREDSYQRYLKNEGEMQSRLEEIRDRMTPAQRKAEPPWETLDKMLKDENYIHPDIPSSGEGRYGLDYEKAGTRLYSGIPVDQIKKMMKLWHGAKRGIRFLEPLEIAPFRTGEGGMARGAGLYVSEEQGVGINYAKMGEEPTIKYKGESLRFPGGKNLFYSIHMADIDGWLRSWSRGELSFDKLKDKFNKDADYNIEEATRRIDQLEKDLVYEQKKPYNSEIISETIADLRGERGLLKNALDDRKLIASMKESDFTKEGGSRYLHEIEVPVDAKWLDWDKPVSMQDRLDIKNALIKKGIVKEGNEDFWFTSAMDRKQEFTGGQIYRMLDELFQNKGIKAGDIEASKFLRDLGFAGNKFAGVSGNAPYSNYVLFAPEKYAKITSMKLFANADLKEMADTLIKSAGKAADYVIRAHEIKKFKAGPAYKALKENFEREFVDRSGNIRQDLLDKLGEVGYRIVQKMYLSKGSGSMAAVMLKQMQKEVYGGLSNNEKKILDTLILTKRILDISGYKSAKQFTPPEDLTPEISAGYQMLFDKKKVNHLEDLSPDRAAAVKNAMTAYFDWMKKPLKDMLDAQLISQKEYDLLVAHNYRRTKLVDIFDKRQPNRLGKKAMTVYDSGVEALQKGKNTDIYEPSSEIMALEVFNRAYGRIFNNAANNTLLDLALKQPDNPFVRTKIKGGAAIPKGWSPVFVFTEGKRKAIYLSPEMSKEWIINSPDISYKLAQVLRYATGSPVLRTMATGINWAFALANLPRDIMHIWYAARTFENGKWSNVYNSNFPVYAAQMGRDLSSVVSDSLLRKGRYLDYIKEGGGMEFLVHQGRLFQKGRHLGGNFSKIMDFLGYLGETSEIMTRLAIRERAMRQGKSAQEATFAARDYMDFGQGGGIAKAADNAFPYLNASIQGMRGLGRAFKENPIASSWKLSQFAAATVGTYIAGNTLAPNTMAALRGNVAMRNNVCIPLGDGFGMEDEKGQMRYFFFKLPLDPSQRLFKALFEAGADAWLGNKVDTGRIGGAMADVSPVGSWLPPLEAGAIGYMNNTDFWLNEDIWTRTDKPAGYKLPMWLTGGTGGSEKEFIEGQTPQAFIDLGKATGLSPERSKYAISQLTTNGSMFGYLAGQGYDAFFSDLPKKEKQWHLMEALSKYPITSRFIGMTNPYTQYAENIQETQNEIQFRKFQENSGLDLRARGYLYDGNYSRGEVDAYINEFKDRDTRERLKDRFKFLEKMVGNPALSFYTRLKGLDDEARARVYIDTLDKATPDEYANITRGYSQAERAGGIVTKGFKKHLRELRNQGYGQ